MSEIDTHAQLPPPASSAEWVGWTTVQQALASDPARSAWVSANAGSGKTHVLTQRVMRLLLAGARPSSILCLTYTKAAASEMSNRVFQRLAEWATISDEELKRRLHAMENSEPDKLRLAEARRLFARALETPGGLKIQTIHAFCEALLHQFPLEANVAGHFSVLDDRSAAALLADARRSLLTATTGESDPDLAEAFADVLTLADDTGLESLLESIVDNRNALRRFLKDAQRNGGPEPVLRSALGLGNDETEQSVVSSAWPVMTASMMQAYLDTAEKLGGKKAGAVADQLKMAMREEDARQRFDILRNAFLTAKGEPKADSGLFTAKMVAACADLDRAVLAARDRIAALSDRLKIMAMFTATVSALTLAERLEGDYEDLKRQRCYLDFEDLIVRTADLLTRSDAAAWVHYKLDQGIDHILVDEAQDTSPEQWRIIKALSGDFFSGKSSRETRRTLFAVGDEKQSIYSFQGARPERFSEERSDLARRVRPPALFSSIRLPLSFRSTDTVLSAVDQVFSLADNARGLSADGEAVEHRSSRIGHPGSVDFWEMIPAEPTAREEDWTAPFDTTPESAPAAILARRIAETISQLIQNGTVTEKGKVRAIEAGDILVLVRKRDAFVNALNRALKRRGRIPVAGADRLRLTSHIAVQDLMALGRHLVLPQDDLSLAAVLKSPLFDLSEEDLFRIAAERPEGSSVAAHLVRLAEEDLRFQAVCERLALFGTLARNQSVHDFYARVLGQYGGRRQFLARLGSEVSDIMDEFLSFALEHEQAGLPGLSAFLATLETESPEVKREQDKGRGEVRIMTVHAAKGLEAPVVFLVDGGSKAFDTKHLPKFRLLQTGGTGTGTVLPVWVPNKSVENSLTDADGARLRAAGEEEYRRLLYVGMTRAADHLVICGYRGKRVVPDTWQSLIQSALQSGDDPAAPTTFQMAEGEWEGLRWRKAADADLPGTEKVRETASAGSVEASVPAALSTPLPRERALPRPLSPSEAGIIVDDEAGDLDVPSPLFGEKSRGSRAAERGRLTHRMLQILPSFAPDERTAAARRYLERTARFWPVKERETLLASLGRLLDEPLLQPIFSAGSQPEVAVMGTLSLGGRDYAISGRIDRLAVSDEEVTLVDFKTNRNPPQTPEKAPLSHRAQLAIYREILKPLYPGKSITCLLVYTETGALLPLDSRLLESSLAEITPK